MSRLALTERNTGDEDALGLEGEENRVDTELAINSQMEDKETGNGIPQQGRINDAVR